MVGFMNEEAFQKTVETGFATFFSRTRNTLWTKGETSGNRLKVVSICTDCDRDTFLIKVRVEGKGRKQRAVPLTKDARAEEDRHDLRGQSRRDREHADLALRSIRWEELAQDYELEVDKGGFERELEGQRERARASSVAVKNVSTREATLEDVFVRLTRHEDVQPGNEPAPPPGPEELPA